MKIEKIKEIIENLEIENPSEEDIEAVTKYIELNKNISRGLKMNYLKETKN